MTQYGDRHNFIIIITSMSRNSISDPDKFELASVVTKNSRTGITSNRRLLVIKRGHLYYYSNVPKFFNGDPKVLQNFHELPKCSINIMDIRKIKGFEPVSSYFSIEFEAKLMMQREDIRKTLTNEQYNFTPKNTSEEVTWQFTCDNQFIKQRWVSALNNLKEHYANEQANIKKYFDTVNNAPQTEEVKSSYGSFSSRSSVKVPWRESVVSRKSYTLDGNKGFQFKDSSPKSDSIKLQDITTLKKGKSGDLPPHKPEKFIDFDMLIQQEPKIVRLEEAFKISQVRKDDSFENEKIVFMQPTIEEVPQDQSVSQTPIKEDSISYQQQQQEENLDRTERRASMEQTLNDLKLYSETHPSQIEQVIQEDIPQIYVSVPLPTVEEKPEPPASKIQTEFEKMNMSSYSNETPPSQLVSSKKSEQMAVGCEFQWLLSESCRSYYKFDLRLQNQRSLLGLMQLFKEKAINNLSDWLDSKNRGQSRYKSTEQSNRITLVEANKMQLKVALLTTQNILINDRQRIFFNEDSIKNLKRQFKVYQNLFRMMANKIKSEPTLKLRVPLTIYLEYKGVACIAFNQHLQQENTELDKDKWALEKSILIEEGYQADWFNFKAVGPYIVLYVKTRSKNIDKDEQFLKDYLKKLIKVGRSDKNHNIAFEPPIDRTFLDIAYKENASTSIQSLDRYVKGLKYAKGLQGTCPKQQIIAALEYCIYCKHLRKVYRSAQGEMDETHFFNLVFKKDPSITHLLEQSCCPPLTTIKGQLFSFIEHYFGVLLEIDEKIWKDSYLYEKYSSESRKKDLFVSSTVRPLLRQLPIQVFQTMESFSKLNFYLESRHPLACAALQKKKEIYLLSSQSLPIDQSLQLLYNEATFYYYESDFIGCIRKCKKYEQLCPAHYTKLLVIYLLMMKAYSEFSQADFSLTLRKAAGLIEFNYGVQHSCFVNLFSLAGFYYSKLAQKPNKNKGVDLRELAVKLVRQAQQLCLRYFGIQSKQYLDILLDLSRLHRSMDANSALSFFKEAKGICQANVILATPENILAILCYETQLYLQMGVPSQSDNALQVALTYVDSKFSNKIKRYISKLQYELGFYMQKYQYCVEAIERLWEIGNPQKLQALQLAYKIGMRVSGASESDNLIDENDSVRFQSQQKSLMQLQSAKHQHSSLVELIINSIETNNSRLLTLIFYLINR